MRSVSNWRNGFSIIPRPISIILEGMERDKINRDWLVQQVENELRELVD